MELKFFSIDEVKDFVKQLKGTRGGKGGDGEATSDLQTGQIGSTAPAPIMPGAQAQAGTFQPQTQFQPPNPNAGFPGQQQQPGPFAGAGGVDPQVSAIVQRIVAKIDWATSPPPQGAGQPVVQTLNWFRGQCGPEAANATLDQIKQTFLYKLPLAQLTQIVQMMGG